MYVKFEVEGVGQVVKDIGLYEMDKKKQAIAVVRKVTGAVGRTARGLVPVSPADRKKTHGSPGDLKSSIRAKYYHNGLVSVTIPYMPKGAHRNIIEKGTIVRANKRGANRGQITGKPFMMPARDAHTGTFNREMAKIWESEVEI